MTAYYNDNDPYCCQWLRNLIAQGLIAAGDVDERSITEVRADDVRGYTQCHFFAGIGGWSIALRLAGWPDGRRCWTGSCPCQPLSGAGARRGHADERHLWPAFHLLIAECSPAVVFGEQVASKDGREWLAAVRTDLAGLGYACGAADLPAAGVGAPHIRQRLWFVAGADRGRRGEQSANRQGGYVDGGIGAGGMADADGGNAGSTGLQGNREHGQREEDGGIGELANSHVSGLEVQCIEPAREERAPFERSRKAIGVVNTASTRCDGPEQGPETETWDETRMRLLDERSRTFWSDAVYIPCTDGKARPAQSRFQPLAHGVQRRASKLRAYGNAIVPQVATEFVKAYMACRP